MRPLPAIEAHVKNQAMHRTVCGTQRMLSPTLKEQWAERFGDRTLTGRLVADNHDPVEALKKSKSIEDTIQAKEIRRLGRAVYPRLRSQHSSNPVSTGSPLRVALRTKGEGLDERKRIVKAGRHNLAAEDRTLLQRRTKSLLSALVERTGDGALDSSMVRFRSRRNTGLSIQS